MKLDQLFSGIDAQVPREAASVEVRSLAVDSRKVETGSLFAALRGTEMDGAAFAPQAVSKGAVAVLCDHRIEVEPAALVVAKDARRAFSLAASRFHGEPSKRMKLLGVTGTNGKTTTAYLAEQICAGAGIPTGLLGTVETRWPGGSAKATHTTPESHELSALLARMVDAGARVAAMEVSSHALSQERVAGCTFAAAAFTNLTRDHLDYHGTLEAYFEAKARLFRELLPQGAAAVLNLDDERVAQLARELRGKRLLGFTRKDAPGAALLARDVRSGLDGVSFELVHEKGSVRVDSPLVGEHNVENLMSAAGLVLGAGIVEAAALPGLVRSARGAPGRLERVMDPSGRIVLVDYAHTDDALARVLDAIRKAGAPRIVCVFGCGGDRDRGKRPLMGEAAGRRAELAVVTSDNPRTEDPMRILAEIEPGLRKAGREPVSEARARAQGEGYCVVPDRRAAIELALSCARAGDAVLIAGKGHEDYQIVGTQKRSFDDRLEAGRALEGLR
ncbi:MAG: UDP-N-acetylmuramoyl-L-alanyl-D-glutamate--2,6-diaminopimelate ligase [Myxococcales bacterium]